MRVRLTLHGRSFYPRKRRARARCTGTVLGQLPSGALVVDWPWGVAFNAPSEVEIIAH